MFAHGNHDPLENSTPGYLYLCQLLASHGIIAATIDVNFLNGGNFGENDAPGDRAPRASQAVPHLEQHGRPSAARQESISNRIAIVGHSRGGEGVGHASFFNRLTSIKPDIFTPVVPLDGSAGLGPYRFDLTAVAAIAPTDRQYHPLTGPTVVPDRYLPDSRQPRRRRLDVRGLQHLQPRACGERWPTRRCPTASSRHCCGCTAPTTTSSTAPGRPKRRRRRPCRAPTRNRSRRSSSARLRRRCCCDRAEYLEVLRDHAARGDVDARRTSTSCRSTRIPSACSSSTTRKALAAPQVSLPVQGTVAADCVDRPRGS